MLDAQTQVVHYRNIKTQDAVKLMRVIKKKDFSCFKMTRAIRNNNHAKQTNPIRPGNVVEP